MSKKMFCDCPFTRFEVNNPNGKVTFCSEHNMVLGNVKNNTIKEIWNGEAYKQVRQKFLDGKIFEICSKNCPVLNGWKDYEKLGWYNQLPTGSEAYKNALLNEEEIQDSKVILSSNPRWLRFSASYVCNLKCYHCFERADRKAELHLPDSFFEDLKKYFDTAQMIFFYGGEPFIEKSNLDLLEYLGRNGLPARVFIVSNGTVLNDTIKATLEKLNFGFLDISIDSADEKLYEKLRYPAKWRDTLEHLKFFSALMKKKGGQLFFAFTINKKNQDELIKYIKFSMDMGAVPFFQFAHNVFKEDIFRKDYEIFSLKEHISVRKRLLEAKSFLRSVDLPMTRKNIDYLLPFSHYYLTILRRMNGFISAKMPGVKKVLKKVIKKGL